MVVVLLHDSKNMKSYLRSMKTIQTRELPTSPSLIF